MRCKPNCYIGIAGDVGQVGRDSIVLGKAARRIPGNIIVSNEVIPEVLRQGGSGTLFYLLCTRILSSQTRYEFPARTALSAEEEMLACLLLLIRYWGPKRSPGAVYILLLSA